MESQFPDQGIERVPPALDGGVFPTGPLGKSLLYFLDFIFIYFLGRAEQFAGS